jgi:hypothetical protein
MFDVTGLGPDVPGALLVAAGDNPERLFLTPLSRQPKPLGLCWDSDAVGRGGCGA